METSEQSNTLGLHLEFVCLRKVRQACDAMRTQSVVLNSRVLYSLFTQERSLVLVYVAVPRGVPPEWMSADKSPRNSSRRSSSCGQSLMDKPPFRETFCEVLCLQWGVLRAGTEAQHFLTRSLQQLYTVRILSRRLIDSTRLVPVVCRDESRKCADESW